MIPKIVIREYFNRQLDNHLWIKDLTKDELQEAINGLHPKPKLYDDLKKHQLACFLLGVSYPRFAFWLDMGVGKTLISLELLNYWYQYGKVKRAIVFITSDTAFPTWEKQIKAYGINMPYILLDGSSAEKWEKLAELENGLIFISYPGAVALTSSKTTTKKSKKVKWKTDPKLVARLGVGVDAIVADESTRASGYDSLTFQLLKRLSHNTHACYALAGRPFGRDPTLLWAQHYIVDRGETLGETLGLFREAYFNAKPNIWGGPYSFDYTFKPALRKQLSTMIQHRSIAYSAQECIDLPSFVPIIEEVSFPDEQHSYYATAVKTIIKSRGDMRAIKNVFMRLRQLSSGFMGFKDDETGERAQVEFKDNPKFDRLLELLGEMPDDRKAVVFYDFTFSGRKITEAANELGLNPIWLWSGTKNTRAELARFETKDDCRLAVVQNRVGALSLDGLQIANYCFFYESPVGVIDREQAERRLRRQGQTRKVFQYDLVVRGSMDARILQYHKQGEDLLKALLRKPELLANG